MLDSELHIFAPRTAKEHWMKKIVLALLRGYQMLLSSWTVPKCRYLPTCSNYAVEAVEKFGVLRGGWLAIKRISRCHPLGGHGFDPVPDDNDHTQT